MVVIAAPLFACGGSPTSPHVDTPVASAPKKCRHYATDLSITTTFNGGSSSSQETKSCAFDTAAHVLRCTLTGSSTCTTQTETTTYPSVADFVEEADAVARRRYSTIEWGCGSSTTTDTQTYDAQKRLLKLSRSTGTFDMTFTAWDAAGRPTQSNTVVGSCPGTATVAYDDSARTATWKYAGGSGCGYSATETIGYDGIGTFVNWVYVDPYTSWVESRTVTATAEVCE
jgi:hypothetical protein